jgi:hypothetical protein
MCLINVDLGPEFSRQQQLAFGEDGRVPSSHDMLQFDAGEYGNMSEEYRRRIIENNFELMNGQTIQVTTDSKKVPKYF